MGAIEDQNSKTHVSGGASAVPTPANNVTGNNKSVQNSSNYQGPGHTSIQNPAESSGEFLGLRHQKGAAEEHFLSREAKQDGSVDERLHNGLLKETCETEDHSFMGRKPGSDGSFLKGAWDLLTK